MKLNYKFELNSFWLKLSLFKKWANLINSTQIRTELKWIESTFKIELVRFGSNLPTVQRYHIVANKCDLLCVWKHQLVFDGYLVELILANMFCQASKFVENTIF